MQLSSALANCIGRRAATIGSRGPCSTRGAASASTFGLDAALLAEAEGGGLERTRIALETMGRLSGGAIGSQVGAGVGTNFGGLLVVPAPTTLIGGVIGGYVGAEVGAYCGNRAADGLSAIHAQARALVEKELR
eukprot:TRINITY_DN7096_c0_g2_i2.p1 TRINITY_DN7096_c0_g2~~TRINITY_DN7096_c0_g2_i2.p1  ORF type:complete len:150 (-),score=28.33 TRINITY_DN7096_c0_g2_i2:139-540(-)